MGNSSVVYVHALMTRKSSSAVGMRNAILRNHLNFSCRLSCTYVIDYEFRHNIRIVKVALDPRRDSHYAHCTNYKSMCLLGFIAHEN